MARRPSDVAGRPSDLAGRPSDLAGRLSPFYRTSSPTGAAALLQQRKLKSNKLENYS